MLLTDIDLKLPTVITSFADDDDTLSDGDVDEKGEVDEEPVKKDGDDDDELDEVGAKEEDGDAMEE